jgi:Prokaryotic E2 family A
VGSAIGSERVESIIFDVDVEVSQLRAFDIRPQERICVSFTTKDETWPETLALRQDFPSVPHLNLTPPGVPRCLCLYEQHYSEERLRWASISIVERVRVWMSDTARGVLHKEDQPLEPVFLGTRNTIVLPADHSTANCLR